MTLTAEQGIRYGLDLIENLEDAQDAIEHDPAAAKRQLQDTIEDVLVGLPPVPVKVAAELLELSQPTVRSWLDKGVLVEPEVKTSSVRQLDPRRLHDVLHLVRVLRERGTKAHELMDKVWWRLSDQAVLDREDLQESLAQMRRGDLVDL
jgi:DNA-binding transcriptional MerR regulator